MNNLLAASIASLAHKMRDAITQVCNDENDGALHRLMEVMLPSATSEQFADIFAQTACCGLFAARCRLAPDIHVDRTDLVNLPVTHPFLRALFDFIAASNLDERIALVVDQLIETLNNVDLDVIRRDYGQRDPLIHFYESFLAAYDPVVRGLRGVYYTPEPVISYIVRSVDHLLKTAFGLPDGLADAADLRKASEDGLPAMQRVQVYDPAMGTGAFLRGIIDHIYASFQGDTYQWADYAARYLLPRLSGCELLPTPYAVAHMQLGLRLAETGYAMRGSMPLRLLLANALEGEQILVDPANAPIMVIVGNPPYAGHSANNGAWISDLLRGKDNRTGQHVASYFAVDGRPLNERNSKWLNDDYVKFIRYAQWLIERAGCGILAFVTNHGYLDNPTFRGMRRGLVNSFDDIYVLDLYGNSKKNKRAPDGTKDENVFDVQQGIAIGIFARREPRRDDRPRAAIVYHADLRGPRDAKFHWLAAHDITTTTWTTAKPSPPFYRFTPQDITLREEYERGWSITEIMPVNSLGVLTKRDALAIGFSEQELLQKITMFADPALTDTECAARFDLPMRDKDKWDIARARTALRGKVSASSVRRIAYRPMDARYIYYDDALVARRNTRVMRHLEQPNRALVLGRQGEATGADSWDVLFAVATLADQNIFRRGGGTVFPLYLYPDAIPNFSPAFIAALSATLKMQFVPCSSGDLIATFGPNDVFNYMYAILHAPTYCVRYADFLKIDFPRLPLSASADLFRTLCPLGARLSALHLLESRGNALPAYSIAGNNLVERITYHPSPGDPQRGRVYINSTQYFEGISPDVWAYHIGGYQLCYKWLKDRKGRMLSPYEDIQRYRCMVASLAETLMVIKQIDAEYSLFVDNAV